MRIFDQKFMQPSVNQGCKNDGDHDQENDTAKKSVNAYNHSFLEKERGQ